MRWGGMEHLILRSPFPRQQKQLPFRERIRPEEGICLGSCTEREVLPQGASAWGSKWKRKPGTPWVDLFSQGSAVPPEEAGYKLYRAGRCRRQHLNTMWVRPRSDDRRTVQEWVCMTYPFSSQQVWGTQAGELIRSLQPHFVVWVSFSEALLLGAQGTRWKHIFIR